MRKSIHNLPTLNQWRNQHIRASQSHPQIMQKPRHMAFPLSNNAETNTYWLDDDDDDDDDDDYDYY